MVGIPEGRCPVCQICYQGWALLNPLCQTCPSCGVPLVIVDSEGKLVANGAAPSLEQSTAPNKV